MATYHSTAITDYWKRQRGLTLVELMIACTLGLLIVLVMSYILMNSLQSRNELIKTSRQIENGRYAMDELRKEIQLAGFYSSYFPSGGVNWTTPNPCAEVFANNEFSATLSEQYVPVGLQGYTQDDATPACITDRLDGTDILVVRRTATQAIEIDGGVNATLLGNAFYLQVSNCPDLAAEPPFVISDATDLNVFNLHKVTPGGTPLSCTTGHLSEIRRFATHLFYISACNDCSGGGDGIPTLKMVEVSSTLGVPLPLAEGIQNMQIEYGFDTSGDGTPDTFARTANSTVTPALRWQDVVTVKVFMLARNVDPTPGHNDTKTYLLSSDGSVEIDAPNDAFRRQAYVTTTMAHNIAGRRH